MYPAIPAPAKPPKMQTHIQNQHEQRNDHRYIIGALRRRTSSKINDDLEFSNTFSKFAIIYQDACQTFLQQFTEIKCLPQTQTNL